jgi:4,5-dihydroxyphthalate decarboxylase
VAKSLNDAFTQAKDEWLAGLDQRIASGAELAGDKKYAKLAKLVGDPLPYGLEANLPTIKYLEEAAFRMNLTPKRMTVEELFVDPSKL